MNTTNSVYVAWQEPMLHDWFVVGLLQQTDSGYVFNYTKGALEKDNFVPFNGMQELTKTYYSHELFPLFQNRVLSKHRPEYPHFIQWLGLNAQEATPIEVIARTGGLRNTDQLQMFKRINFDNSGNFEYFFFVHGVGYLDPSAKKRVSELDKGDKLFLLQDSQNQYDKFAIAVRAENPAQLIGYCPRYLARDIRYLLDNSPHLIELNVECKNKDAPTNYQLLCKLSGKGISSEVIDLINMHRDFETIRP